MVQNVSRAARKEPGNGSRDNQEVGLADSLSGVGPRFVAEGKVYDHDARCVGGSAAITLFDPSNRLVNYIDKAAYQAAFFQRRLRRPHDRPNVQPPRQREARPNLGRHE